MSVAAAVADATKTDLAPKNLPASMQRPTARLGPVAAEARAPHP
jgi:hypothetical protein